MDSVVEMDEKVITIQDYEKSISFCEVGANDDQIMSNIKPINEWFNQISKGIAAMQKRHRICGVCNQNCEFNAELDEEIRMMQSVSPSEVIQKIGKDSLKAVICRGCGRCICVNCMDMKADTMQDASDKTLYCIHCRNWNERKFEPLNNVFSVVPEKSVNGWDYAVGNSPSNHYYFNPVTKEVSWEEPQSDVHYDSSYCVMDNAEYASPTMKRVWLSYPASDGKYYYYNMNTDQVQWRQTIEVMGGKGDKYCCMNCGHESNSWFAVCPNCKKRWSLCIV